MGYACVAYSEEYEEQFRKMLHDELDKWVDELLPLFDQEQPTLMDISQVFTKTRQKFLGACVQRLIEEKYSDLLSQEYSVCPTCGTLCKKRRNPTKKMVTMQGPSSLKRPWFYCHNCAEGFSPLDETLQISRKKYQFDVQQKTTRISTEDAFRTGSEIFEDLTGQHISDHFMHETFQEVGAEAYIEDIIPQKEEIEERIKKATTNTWRPILVVASDGAHLPTRPKARRNDKRGKGRWQEAKGFRLYLLDKERIIHIASWHQIQNEEQFGEDLRLAASRIPQDSVRIGLLGDGADWLWKHMTACFPQGRQILDYYHCLEHIYQVAKAQYGDSIKAIEWIESTICRLFFAEVGYVIGGLRRMEPKDAEAKEQIRKLIGYLDHNRERIHYKGDRIGGYPIGSGGIESANKFICHTRMKRSGAWWVKETGNEMLRIRCAIYNGTYDRVFERYKKAHMAKNVIRLLTNR